MMGRRRSHHSVTTYSAANASPNVRMNTRTIAAANSAKSDRALSQRITGPTTFSRMTSKVTSTAATTAPIMACVRISVVIKSPAVRPHPLPDDPRTERLRLAPPAYLSTARTSHGASPLDNARQSRDTGHPLVLGGHEWRDLRAWRA